MTGPKTGIFIGNEWVEGNGTFDTVNPSTEEVIAGVERGGEREVDAAVAAAREAFRGEWSKVKPPERARMLYGVARELERRAEEFARLETLDAGKPLQHARAEMASCAAYFDYYAGAADKIHGDTIPQGPDHLGFTVREPVGVTAHIVPWNVPLGMVCRGLAPALAAGNTAVVKPAEQTPLTALKFAEIFLRLGFPAGVYNVVPGYGEEAGKALSEHPEIDSMTFTGSVETGKAVLRAAAEHVKPVVAELGGKSPQVVFADSDLDLVASEVSKGIYSNTGQYCDAGSRLIVEDSAREPLLERLVENAKGWKIGPGMESLDLGPLVSEEHFGRVTGYIESGEREGAEMLIGGRAEEFDRGYFVSPTIFDGVERGMRIEREEIFGPVLTVQSFADAGEASAMANDTPYGLAAAIYTKDIDKALAFATDVQAGNVMINEYYAGGMGSPFGGYKQSGTGREKGLAALDNYTQIKNVTVRIRR
ncbi:aldehyde dehydrogenase family protein [Rubrobacter aplysinae]|uniref:aldehyde dehydrogenase family protein n=1 Tax=Rubrobacter aplysinae TaxID=909625 RepID=UPI00064C264B|nr:aldehyde dehydrogenase family protein [Rubrobacter aplysinae]